MPESGSIRIDGTEMTDLSTRGRDRINADMGMLFQNAALFDSMTVWENVVFGLMKPRKMKPVEARDIAVEKLKLVGLGPDAAALYPAELSGGMKKRVGLARAIATEPKIIFFDEPTTGLDPIMSDVINNLIVDCVKRLGATAVTITHDMVSAGKIADNITMLYKGKNIWTGSADGVRHADNPYVDQFVNGRADGPIRLA